MNFETRREKRRKWLQRTHALHSHLTLPEVPVEWLGSLGFQKPINYVWRKNWKSTQLLVKNKKKVIWLSPCFLFHGVLNSYHIMTLYTYLLIYVVSFMDLGLSVQVAFWNPSLKIPNGDTDSYSSTLWLSNTCLLLLTAIPWDSWPKNSGNEPTF